MGATATSSRPPSSQLPGFYISPPPWKTLPDTWPNEISDRDKMFSKSITTSPTTRDIQQMISARGNRSFGRDSTPDEIPLPSSILSNPPAASVRPTARPTGRPSERPTEIDASSQSARCRRMEKQFNHRIPDLGLINRASATPDSAHSHTEQLNSNGTRPFGSE